MSVPAYIEVVQDKLNEILTRLGRIEERQIATTAMVSEVKEHEGAVVGSFASAELPKDK